MTVQRRAIEGLALVGGLAGAFVFFQGDEPVEVEESPEPSRTTAPPLDATARTRRPVVELEPRPDHDPERRRMVLLNNEAAELLNEDVLERAVELFERCHAAFPEDDVFARNLAEALARLARRHYDERRLERAVDGLERVLELAPGRPDADALAEALERWRKEAALAGGETTDTSRYFELSYDASREDVLHRSGEVLASLEGSYGVLRDWFRVDPIVDRGRAPIRVVLYAPRAFDELTGLGDWAGGAFDGTVRISVADLEKEERRWQRVARHELAHAFLHEIGGGDVPGWLNEGIAQWLEGDSPAARDVQRERARAALAEAELFPLERLQGSLASWKDRAEIERAYAQSFALIDYIVTNHGDDPVLAMVEGCGREEPPASTFEARTGVPLSFVLTDLTNYLR